MTKAKRGAPENSLTRHFSGENMSLGLNDKNERYPIVFIGAGPGDPDYLTLAGAQALFASDLIITAGSLVNPKIITQWIHWKTDPAIVDSAGLTLTEITGLMIKAQKAGLRVARLHTGDPSIYGAVEEQFAKLDKKGVPYQVIPGVTAATAAAARLGMELTWPELTQTLIITRTAGRTPMPPGEDLESLCSHETSLALYLSASQGKTVQKALSAAYGPDSCVCVCHKISWPDERIFITTAGKLAKTLEEEKITRHALILAGPAVSAKLGGCPLPANSKLYDPYFSHAYRLAEEEAAAEKAAGKPTAGNAHAGQASSGKNAKKPSAGKAQAGKASSEKNAAAKAKKKTSNAPAATKPDKRQPK